MIRTICDWCGRAKCGMNVYLRDGKIIRVEGMPEHLYSKGALCPRGYATKQIVYSPDRVKYPLRRVGERGEGKWEKVSWDQALDEITTKLLEIKEKYGSEAVAFIRGHYHAADIAPFLDRLANLFGSPNVSDTGYVCFFPTEYCMIQTFGEMAYPDPGNSECIIVWAGNPTHSNPPLARQIFDAKYNGAKVIVIDPRFTFLASVAEVYAQIRPGTDGALALGVLNIIINEKLYDKQFVDAWTIGFDKLEKLVQDYSTEKVEKITGIPTGIIRKIARIYATNKPASIIIGNALEKHTNIGQAIRAIAILMAITGNLDVPGGNVFSSPLQTALLDLPEKLPSEKLAKRIGAEKVPIFNPTLRRERSSSRTHLPSIWRAVLTGKPYPIKAVLNIACNPVMVCEHTEKVKEAMKKLETLVVADLFMTPTAELADIVLPATTFLETTYYSPYPGRVMLRPKIIEPIGESWPDLRIIFQLGKKLGHEEYFPWRTIEEALDEELKPLGVTVKQLKEKAEGMVVSASTFQNKRYERIGFKTPSKKVEIYSEKLKNLGIDPLPVYKEPAESPVSRLDLAKEYPLILTTGAQVSIYTHSQFRQIPWLHELMPENVAEINLDTAVKLGVKNGDMVIVETPRGEIKVKAKVTEGIAPQVVQVYDGFKKANVNMLIDSTAYDPMAGCAPMNSSLCRVKKV